MKSEVERRPEEPEPELENLEGVKKGENFVMINFPKLTKTFEERLNKECKSKIFKYLFYVSHLDQISCYDTNLQFIKQKQELLNSPYLNNYQVLEPTTYETKKFKVVFKIHSFLMNGDLQIRNPLASIIEGRFMNNDLTYYEVVSITKKKQKNNKNKRRKNKK